MGKRASKRRTVSDRLEVTLYGYPAATLTRIAADDYVLQYDADWLASNETVGLSLSLPLLRRTHRGRIVSNFVDNLLPDNPDVRERWARDAGLDTAEPFALLEHFGQDVAGAASFCRAGLRPAGSRTPITDDDIAERIRVLRDDDTAWHDDRMAAAGQFSLGGAQAKFSLARLGGRWFETTGEEPSTHLFKPQVKGVPDGELVEYVTMRAAHLLGIPAAHVELFTHEGQHSLVVERFDRRTHDGSTTRLHQEDLAQALGVSRIGKYETHGGPGIDRVGELLTSEADAASRARYATMLMFSWSVLSTDAHAKNYSVFLDPDGAKLTPMYDASSVIPSLGTSGALDHPSVLKRAAERRLAVRYGAGFLAGDVGLFELERIARLCGMSAEILLAETVWRLERLPELLGEIAAGMPTELQTDTIARYVEWMPLWAEQAIRQLGISGLS